MGYTIDMPMNRKQIISWCLFDFANSSYSAVIASVLFSVYYARVIVGNSAGAGDLWWGRAISASMLFTAITSPFLGGVADSAGLRKKLLALYTGICILAVCGLSLLTPGAVIIGFTLIVLANIGMEGGLVFYNSFLPRIAAAAYQGRISSWGFSVGYAGSICSLLIALPLATAGNYELTWLVTAGFFAIFSLPAFLFLPGDVPADIPAARAGIRGTIQAWNTLKELWRLREPRKFLIAYLFYEDGVNTVIVFSSIFAATTLGFETGELVGLYLVVQMTALIGAVILAKPTDMWGPKKVVMLSLVLWVLVAVTAYFVETRQQFWAVACTAGLGLGTVQAGTRAFFTQFVPKGSEAEYFGVYSLVGKSSAIFGPLLFGAMSSTFGSQRPAILSIAAFFIIGLILLGRVNGGGPNVKPEAG
ncbi:MAG TPA: MFS transporter [Nitrospirota bacterium]|nr:MFS transporter [Nitrospirota bacterium]